MFQDINEILDSASCDLAALHIESRDRLGDEKKMKTAVKKVE